MRFSLEQSQFNLNGHNVTGWSDDTDALSFPNIDIANIKRGADGRMVAASTGDKGGPVMIKLLPNSPSTKFFMGIIAAQQRGAAVEFNGIFRDPVNGITVTLQRGILTNGPLGQTLGKGDAANREFTIEFERVTPDYTAANFQ